MLSSSRVIPFNTQPLALRPFYLAMIANRAKLTVERESFANVERRVGGHVFRWSKSSVVFILI